MEKVQEIFNRIQEAKKKQKDLRQTYKDAIASSLEYREVKDKIEALRMRKKQIETALKEQFSGELNKLDEIKFDLQSDNELLSDAALSTMMKGETVEITDEYNNKYEPIFSVKFKKV